MMDRSSDSCSSAALNLMLPALAGVAAVVLDRNLDLELLLALGEGEREGGDKPARIASCAVPSGYPEGLSSTSGCSSAAASAGLLPRRFWDRLGLCNVPADARWLRDWLLLDWKLNRGCCQPEQDCPSSSPSSYSRKCVRLNEVSRSMADAKNGLCFHGLCLQKLTGCSSNGVANSNKRFGGQQIYML